MTIIDLPEPRVGTLRSKNPIKLAKDVILSMRGDDRDRDRDSDSLDDTRSRILNSPLPPNDSEFRINDRRAQIPQWLLLVVILQGSAAIYSWATMRSDINYNKQEIIRLEAKIDAESKSRSDDIKVINLQRDKDKDIIRDLIRDGIADQLLNRGVIRIQQQP